MLDFMLGAYFFETASVGTYFANKIKRMSANKMIMWGDKMRFNYHNPKDETELAAILTGMEDYCLLAGGTDVMVKMKEKLISPANVVDVGGIESLRGILQQNKSVWIGALTTHREVMDSQLLQQKAQALCQAAGEVGSPQIRNVGTIGGNIGNASPAADTIPVLLVLDGKACIKGVSDEEVELDKLFAGPGKTTLKAGQYIAGVRISWPTTGEGVSFVKYGKRRALACSIVNGAAWVRVQDGIIVAARIALGAVAPTPVRLYDVEKWLVGRKADSAAFAEAGLQAEKCVRPIDDVRCTATHRGKLARVAVRRCLEAAVKQAMEVCVCE